MTTKLHSKKFQKSVWIILTILVLPAFVLWGSGSMSDDKNEMNYVGKIFGRKIPFAEFKEAVAATRNMGVIQFGDQFAELQKSMDIESQAWERLILLAEAKNRNIRVSDKEVVSLIQGYPFFQKNGAFDQSLYNQLMQFFFQSQPRTFEEQSRQNIAISKLFKNVTDRVEKPSEKEIKEEYRKVNEEVSIQYLAGIPTDFQKDVVVTDEALKEFFKTSSLQFKQPLTFNIEYVTLSSEGIDPKIQGDKIKKIMQRLRKKENFAAVAKDFGLTVKETGLFAEDDPIPSIGWSPKITGLISKTNKGDCVNPFQYDKSYYLMQIKEKKEPFIPEFDTIKDKVKEEYIKSKSKELAKAKIEACAQKMQELYRTNPKQASFEQMAKEFGLKINTTGSFKFGTYIEGLGASDHFWIVAAGLSDESFSAPFETPSGFFIIRIKSRIPIDEKKLESEKEKFQEALLMQKKQEFFNGFTRELKNKAQKY